MTGPTSVAGNGHSQYFTRVDEMSLSDEQAAQTADADVDELEVRVDSIAIMQGTMNELRRPLLRALVVVGAAGLVIVSTGLIIKRLRPAPTLRAQLLEKLRSRALREAHRASALRPTTSWPITTEGRS
ncbi:MAG: hypothetical protein Q7K25_02320 [Actinomycetota bacterium]|nr:hypothetical protein [Actinomycetota bacterium]